MQQLVIVFAFFQVYKKKTEAAKKEYLKALAAYRASLVSKGAGEGEGMYGGYGNYNAGAPQYGGYSPQNTLPSPPMSSAPTPPTQQQPMAKKPMMTNMSSPQQQQHQNMIQSSMGPVPTHINMQHMQQQHSNNYMQQVCFSQILLLSCTAQREFILSFLKGIATVCRHSFKKYVKN